MGKPLGIEQIKTVIDEIRQGPKDWNELKSLRVQKKPIPDKTLERILKEYLGYWGLVSKNEEDQKWSWFLRKQVFENRDIYNLALKHSQWLVFGGVRPSHDGSYQGIGASINTLDQFAFRNKRRTDYQEFEAFFQHIKTGYPQLYQKLEKYARLLRRRGELTKPAIEKDSNIDILGHLNYDLNRQFYPQGYRDLWGPAFAQEDKDRLERLHRIFSEEELEWLDSNIKETMTVAESAVEELALISCQLESGRPLMGTCDLCPHLSVTIKTAES